MTNSEPPINGQAIEGEVHELVEHKPAYHDQLAFLSGVLAIIALTAAIPLEILLWKWALA